MEFISDPSSQQLAELQKELSNERGAGIVDIHGNMVSKYYALSENEKLIGVSSVSYLGESCVEIYKIYISPSRRRERLGRKLLDQTIRCLAKNGIAEVCIESTEESRLFWESVKSDYEVKEYFHNKFCILIGS